jgi:hypothetical protein
MRDKRNKFIILAERRVTKAIHAIRLVGNLGNRTHYEYTDVDVKQIISTLDSEIRALRTRFRDETGGQEAIFRLPR